MHNAYSTSWKLNKMKTAHEKMSQNSRRINSAPRCYKGYNWLVELSEPQVDSEVQQKTALQQQLQEACS